LNKNKRLLLRRKKVRNRRKNRLKSLNISLKSNVLPKRLRLNDLHYL
jgi:hypothetical protein